MADNSRFALKVWYPAGVTLAVIGFLTLLTPLFTRLQPHELIIDIISGAILMVFGMVGIFKGRKG